MKTLNQHNCDIRNASPDDIRAGVCCDRCKTEMVYPRQTSNTLLLTNPHKQEVQCPNCDFIGYKF